MDDVRWIKIKVGMFDGSSFKRIKRAKIGGESFRDKLTAVWFELMDLAGQCNHGGALIDKREIAYESMDDIAVMIDRDPEELNLCMQFFLNEGMIEIVDNVYMLSNWLQYQNAAGLDKIREQSKARQARFRAKKKELLLSETTPESNVIRNVTSNVTERDSLYSSSSSGSKESGSLDRGSGGKTPEEILSPEELADIDSMTFLNEQSKAEMRRIRAAMKEQQECGS